jgi:hypothetical protein
MSSGYRVSLARIASVVFTVFVLAFAHGAYITYCVLPRIYEADAKIEVPRLDISGPIHNELEIINSPDVLSPIITGPRARQDLGQTPQAGDRSSADAGRASVT